MKAIAFTIHTQQPFLATSFQGDPNSDVSYPYIPGSMIRGALIGRYLQRNGLQDADILNNETVRRLFFDGNARYLNAYISSQKEKRTFPALLSWRKEKGEELKKEGDGITVYDFSIEIPAEDELKSPKSVGGYFWAEESYVRFYTVKRRINVHNSRDRSKGRSTEDEGEIFRYEATDSRQKFQGIILCEEADEQTFIDLLQPADMWLGGSRSAGYGHVKIEGVESRDDWNEIGIAPEERANCDNLTITLLSDMILRDEWGQPAAIPPTQALSEMLEIELKKPENVYTNSTIVGGFNRKWGLPLPQVPALAAGSVFVYENVRVTAEQILELEREGLGERRVEGFGRVAVNWRSEESQFYAKLPEKETPSQRKQPKLQHKESCKLAAEMAERIFRQRLEQHLLSQIETNKLERKRNGMSNSQLSRLMGVTQRALNENSRKPLDDLLAQLKSTAGEQFDRAKVNAGKSLKQQIKDWLDRPSEWIGNIEPVTLAGETCSLTDELAMEYTLRLILAVAKNATKEKENE